MCKSQCEGHCINFNETEPSAEHCMNGMVTRSLLEEGCITWNALLNSFKNENSFLIIKLSQVVDGLKDKSLLHKAEYFQNEFIITDEYITELKKDIKIHRQLLGNSTEVPGVSSRSLKNHEKLKNEIVYFEKKFLNLKTEFDKSINGTVN